MDTATSNFSGVSYSINECKTMIAFTDEQMVPILDYLQASEAATVQDAILNAISLAFDDQDKVSEE